MTQPIKVMQFICPTGFYGAERWVLALANNLDRSVVACELVVTMEPGQKPLQLVAAFEALGLSVHIIQTTGRFDRGAIQRLARLLAERHIDVLHTHGYKSDILGLLAARSAKVKSICTPHGFENTKDLKLRTFIWLGCQTFRFFDAVAPLSKDLEKAVMGYGVKQGKCHYIQNGVDLKDLKAYCMAHPRSQNTTVNSTDPQTSKIIGFVGQMISRKNIKDLLDIFDSICAARGGGHYKLQLLGDGEDKAGLMTYASKLNCANDIEFLGFVDNRFDYMNAFDLFVMTSSLEGIPRCLMEALAMQLPVAAYDIAGIDQLVKHQQTGLLVPFGNQNALASACLQILDDDTLAGQLGKAGAEFVEQYFSASRMADEYSELFKRVVAQPHRATVHPS